MDDARSATQPASDCAQHKSHKSKDSASWADEQHQGLAAWWPPRRHGVDGRFWVACSVESHALSLKPEPPGLVPLLRWLDRQTPGFSLRSSQRHFRCTEMGPVAWICNSIAERGSEFASSGAGARRRTASQAISGRPERGPELRSWNRGWAATAIDCPSSHECVGAISPNIPGILLPAIIARTFRAAVAAPQRRTKVAVADHAVQLPHREEPLRFTVRVVHHAGCAEDRVSKGDRDRGVVAAHFRHECQVTGIPSDAV